MSCNWNDEKVGWLVLPACGWGKHGPVNGLDDGDDDDDDDGDDDDGLDDDDDLMGKWICIELLRRETSGEREAKNVQIDIWAANKKLHICDPSSFLSDNIFDCTTRWKKNLRWPNCGS